MNTLIKSKTFFFFCFLLRRIRKSKHFTKDQTFLCFLTTNHFKKLYPNIFTWGLFPSSPSSKYKTFSLNIEFIFLSYQFYIVLVIYCIFTTIIPNSQKKSQNHKYCELRLGLSQLSSAVPFFQTCYDNLLLQPGDSDMLLAPCQSVHFILLFRCWQQSEFSDLITFYHLIQ